MLLGWRAVFAVFGALALLAFVPAGAGADTYTVTRTDDPPPSGCLPGDCSLREALDSSNASTAVDDVVVLPASAVPYAVQAKALDIEDEVEVRGAAANRAVVKGDGTSVVVANGSPGVILV